jgi:uncharacterized membrane protein
LFFLIVEFIGRFHPLVVHLPIGIMLFALLLQWISHKSQNHSFKTAVGIAYLAGFTGALFSCITGLILSNDGGYEEDTLSLHKWMGIAVAILSLVGYLASKKEVSKLTKVALTTLIFTTLSITGHLGGTLTHGEDYLNWNAETKQKVEFKQPVITDVQSALVYGDVVQPILQTKCYSCHSASRQKGKLRLDNQEWISKGGKNGEVIVPGDAQNSELYARLTLDINDDKHMPPKSKTQLSENEKMLLHWWISNGVTFNKTVKEFPQNEKQKIALSSLEKTAAIERKTDYNVPTEPIEQAPTNAITALQKMGISVVPVAANSHYLSVNFISLKIPSDSAVLLLKEISKQLVWLRLSNAQLNNHTIEIIANCPNITRLHLDNCHITDSLLQQLNKLTKLQYLNLKGTPVTITGLSYLKNMPSLNHLFLYQTSVQRNEWESVKKLFPKAYIDSGNYRVATLPSDTTIVKKS